jgi:hypothetical protein
MERTAQTAKTFMSSMRQAKTWALLSRQQLPQQASCLTVGFGLFKTLEMPNTEYRVT